MSKILVPSKPLWKITLTVNTENQVQIQVEDLSPSGHSVILGQVVRSSSRQMNQIEMALILSNTLSSILVNTLNVSKRGMPDAPKEENNDGRIS